MVTKFKDYSVLSKSQKDKTSYLQIKRLALRIEQNNILQWSFNRFIKTSFLYFALRYFDLEEDSDYCFYDENRDRFSYVDGLKNFFCSLYQEDRSLFQNILNFTLNEIKKLYDEKEIYPINTELAALGYIYDGGLLRTSSGEPLVEQKITSAIVEKLEKINPKLNEMRDGALEALLSNKPDKSRHVASSSRALVNTLLRNLVPEIKDSIEESDIKSRIKKLFNTSESTSEVVEATTKLIQALNKVQSKGDHSSIDNELAFFIFELTDKLVYFILNYKE